MLPGTCVCYAAVLTGNFQLPYTIMARIIHSSDSDDDSDTDSLLRRVDGVLAVTWVSNASTS